MPSLRTALALLIPTLTFAGLMGCTASTTSLPTPTTTASPGGAYRNVVALSDQIEDPAEWGKNFPYHFADYQKTVEMAATKHGGSTAISVTPTDADPRTTVASSKLEADPRLKVMWAGYAFGKDYRERRGHAYMLDDQTYTKRQSTTTPGACINCHASVVKTYLDKGNGDLTKGFEAVNPMTFKDARQLFKHPVACIDCHDPATMKLRITRPAFMEGIKAYKAGQGVADYDVNKQATTREMKSFVCAQCHVTYYFKGAEKRLTFPWDKGLKVEDIYSTETGVNEWTHPTTGAKLVKPRHPEFEMWSQGVHGQMGVSCADCHMGKKSVENGTVSITDHQINSPLLKMQQTCGSCHTDLDARKARVETIQDNFKTLRNEAMDAYVALVDDIAASSASANPTSLANALELQRKGQFMLDYIQSENSVGFHASNESTRILNAAKDALVQGRTELHK